MRKKFFGRFAAKDIFLYNNTDEVEYMVFFNSTKSVERFFKKAYDACYQTNFGCNPYEWAAYGEFELDGDKYVINSPRQSNGDKNWYKYPSISKRYCIIRKIN